VQDLSDHGQLRYRMVDFLRRSSGGGVDAQTQGRVANFSVEQIAQNLTTGHSRDGGIAQNGT